MSLQQFLLILRARYRLALTVALLTLGLAYGTVAWLPRSYSAQTALLMMRARPIRWPPRKA